MQVDFSTTYELNWEAAPETSACLMYTGPGVDPVRHSTTINRDSHSWPKLIFFLPDPTDSVSSSLWSRTEHFVFSVIIFVTCCCSCQFSSFFPVPLCSRIKFSCFLSLSAAAGDNYVVTLGEKSLSRCAALFTKETYFHRCEMALSLAPVTVGKAWKWSAIVVVFLFTIQPLLLSCLEYIHILFIYRAIFQFK